MRYYIIAGEASGDLHGSNLIRELRRQEPDAAIRCWGGDLMEEAGGTLVKHFRELAFMGFVEVLLNLGTILRNLRFCKKDIDAWKPDALILIDYPGFNLRIAEWAHAQGIKVIYYISPQVWAWKENRVKKMKRDIDLMLVILPFEKDYFKNKWQWPVEYVGHPLVEVIERYTSENASNAGTDPVIALLPGSRKQEILKKLPVMLEVSRRFPSEKFIVAKAPGVEDDFYAALLGPYPNVETVSNQTYSILHRSKAAVVTSGTATLETALFHVPEVVCYKGNLISYEIAKRVISIKYISLVNLIMDRLVVKELIQHDMNVDTVAAELNALLTETDRTEQIQKDYTELHSLLKAGGSASLNAVNHIRAFLGS